MGFHFTSMSDTRAFVSSLYSQKLRREETSSPFRAEPQNLPRRSSLETGKYEDYQTVQTTSPPSWAPRASRSVINPFEVDKITIPIPPRICGISLELV